jgi:hypothetical protein
MHAGGAAPIEKMFDASAPSPLGHVSVPVLHLNSEWEARSGIRGQIPPEHDNYCYWEVPGSGHGPARAADRAAKERQRDLAEMRTPPQLRPKYGMPQVSIEYSLHAGIERLSKWITTGSQPPRCEPLRFKGPGQSRTLTLGERTVTVQGVELARDRHGNALRGVRLPHVEAPTVRHYASNDAEQTAQIGGYVPFNRRKMSALYPSHADYVQTVDEACTRAVKDGFLLPLDADDIRREASESDIGG